MANIVIVNTADNVTKILSSDLSDLKTQNKKDIISAINEVVDSVTTKADKSDLETKQDQLTFDDTPTIDSANPVTSDGVFRVITEKSEELEDKIADITWGANISSFTEVETALANKQDKLTFDLTPTIGSDNPITSGAVAVVSEKKTDKNNGNGGFEGGEAAIASSGSATGFDAFAQRGGAAGEEAIAGNGFSGGCNAQAKNDEGTPIDAIQLGTGTNSKPKSLQVYDYTMMDADGTIPEERLADLSLAKTDENNNFTASQTITGTLTVNGDIVQNGASYESHAEQLYTKNDLIKTRDGAIGGLGDGEYTGIEAEKYDGENNGRLVFDANGTARVGDVGSEQPLLTREEASALKDRQLFVWNATTLKAIGVTLSNGFAIARNTETNEEFLIPWGATESAIDQRTSNSNLITPANLDYAVRSVLPKTADTIPSTLVANTEYYAGELAAVSFALPTTGKLGQYCFVKFDSGTTATTLSVTGSYAGDIPTPVANKTYEIIATWNGSEWVCSYRGY